MFDSPVAATRTSGMASTAPHATEGTLIRLHVSSDDVSRTSLSWQQIPSAVLASLAALPRTASNAAFAAANAATALMPDRQTLGNFTTGVVRVAEVFTLVTTAALVANLYRQHRHHLPGECGRPPTDYQDYIND
ncbi:hypothetical protein GT347_09625 [Xylophilus rhododendri]|uniref:Uncharacterized protein n=1 Tax=Xylophilus rhododendri TaxID=2697032 RepID=A0A857J5X5_9BURK|nr:hypothetical protein [Xylophilus rhododendri]QHI98228.1 hypothetical protein GT347_09625 [Xylophilus rhododendri]